MGDIRLRTKSELKRFFTDLKRRGITDDMMSVLIDVLWRDRPNLRTSGFDKPGGTDSILTFDTETRVMKVMPFDPLVEGWQPRFGLWTYNTPPAKYRKMTGEYEVTIPGEEGYFCVYFDWVEEEEDVILFKLTFKKNPTTNELRDIYENKAVVSVLYWDAVNNTAIHAGDDRHGSEWNPQIHWWAHRTFNGLWVSGLQATNLVIGDGSLNTHAQAGIAAGIFRHEDMEHSIAAAASTTGLPVMWFSGAGKLPRVELNPGYMFLRNTFLYYNKLATGIKNECTDGYFMLYHVFATNCVLHPLISVMGTHQYANKNDCCKAALDELNEIKAIMPQQTRLALVSFAFEVNSAFTNDVKARIVQPCTGQGCMIWITEITNWFDILIQIDIDVLEQTVNINIEENNQTLINNVFPAIIGSYIGGFKYAAFVQTMAVTVLYTTVWKVELLNERMGEFKCTVFIHDRSNDDKFHLKAILGFDHINMANRISMQSDIIDDVTVTLTLTINATTNYMEATLTGMPANAKNIHFCFERCILAMDAISLGAEGAIVIGGEAEIMGYGNIIAEGEIVIEAEGEISGYGNMEAEGEIVIESEAEITALANGEAEGTIVIEAEADTMDYGDIVASGVIVILAEAEATALVNAETSGVIEIEGEAEITALTNLEAAGLIVITGAAEISAIASGEAEGTIVIGGDAELTNANTEEWPVAEYGLLYNFHAITNLSAIAPTGYRVATLADVVDLLAYLGGDSVAGGKLKDTAVWTDPNTGATNETGFKATPAGYRENTGTFAGKLLKNRIWIDNR